MLFELPVILSGNSFLINLLFSKSFSQKLLFLIKNPYKHTKLLYLVTNKYLIYKHKSCQQQEIPSIVAIDTRKF